MSHDIRFSLTAGMIVKVYQRIKEKNAKGEEKERIQIFEGMVLAVKHGKESGATATVRKISNGVGVEKIFPLHSPVVEKIELVREMAVRQARAYYLRGHKKKLSEVKKDRVTGAAEALNRIENPVAAKEDITVMEAGAEEVIDSTAK